MVNIVDKRFTQKDGSVVNRQKFIEKYKAKIKEAVKGIIQKSSVKNFKFGNKKVVVNSSDPLDLPSFDYDREDGKHWGVSVGNKHFNPGDRVRKPMGGSGSGNSGSQNGGGEDSFEFTLTEKEFADLFFEDLELPELVKKQFTGDCYEIQRSGYSTKGGPSALNVKQTIIRAFMRKYALKKKRDKEEDKLIIDTSKKKIVVKPRKKISFLEETDLKYNYRDKIDVPSTRAVMFCVDGVTEFLTENGWKPISDYSKKDRVGQYNEDGTVNFVIPKAYIVNDNTADFIQITAQGIDQRLTREHRVIYRSKNGNLKELTANELMEKHNRTLFGFRGKFITHFKSNREGINLSDDEIRLHIAFKADGTYQRSHTNRVQFIVQKERKVTRLIEILNKLNIEYNITKSDKRTRIYFTTDTHIHKRYSDEWYTCSQEQLKIISEEVLYWDGYLKRGTYTSKYKEDVDFIQYVWANQGFGTNLFYSSGVFVVSRCSYGERSLTSKNPSNITITQQDDPFSYCFNVPSGMLILRRNNRIFVTGNCCMDVSGSMGEKEKDIAKRFYILLNMFLRRNYKIVDVVFVRHADWAEECEEEVFFHGRESGGTVISTAYDKILEIIKQRYNTEQWNVYVAQATDGDNFDFDNDLMQSLLTQKLLPIVQYFAYIEIISGAWREGTSTLFTLFKNLSKQHKNLAAKSIADYPQIFEVFRSLFVKGAGSDRKSV